MYQAIIKGYPPMDAEQKLLSQLEILYDQNRRPCGVIFEGKQYELRLQVSPEGKQVVILDGLPFEVELMREVDLLVETLGFNQRKPGENKVVTAPMPGHVIRLNAVAGEQVEKGSMLMTLEAMKMENTVQSPESGIIKEVFVRQGQTVSKGEKLLELE
jgi:biotin carboxyl carrier protein